MDVGVDDLADSPAMAARRGSLIVSPIKIASECTAKMTKPEHRILCFNWTGGGAGFYLQWGEHFPPNIEVLAVRPPGRETRLLEPPYHSADKLIDDVTDLIHKEYGDLPFSFFGHSLGARIAFGSAVRLRQRYNMQAAHLFVSSSHAPHSSIGAEVYRQLVPKPDLSDTELVNLLLSWDMMPRDVLDDPNIIDIYLRPFRGDIKVFCSFSYTKRRNGPELTCPVIYFDGKDDIDKHCQEWSELTSGAFDTHFYPGGHMYLLEENMYLKLRDVIVDRMRTTK